MRRGLTSLKDTWSPVWMRWATAKSFQPCKDPRFVCTWLGLCLRGRGVNRGRWTAPNSVKLTSVAVFSFCEVLQYEARPTLHPPPAPQGLFV